MDFKRLKRQFARVEKYIILVGFSGLMAIFIADTKSPSAIFGVIFALIIFGIFSHLIFEFELDNKTSNEDSINKA